jgi:hypothetical protein
MRNIQPALHLLLLTLPAWALEAPCPRNASEAEEKFGQADFVESMDTEFRRADGGVLNVHQSRHSENNAWQSSATFEWGHGQIRKVWLGTEFRDAEQLVREYASELPLLASVTAYRETTSHRWADCSGSGTAHKVNGVTFFYQQRWIDGSSFFCDENTCECTDAPTKE